MLRGVQLAVMQTNERGGALGRRIKLLRLDDKATPSLARSVAGRAIAAKAVGVIGPYNSSVGIINLPVYVAGKVVPIHLTSTDDTTGKGLTVQPKNSQISPVEARYFESHHATRVAMLVDPSTYTKGMADRLRRILKSRGGEVVTIPIVAGKQSYSTQVAEALKSKPQLVYVSTYLPGRQQDRRFTARGRYRRPHLRLLHGSRERRSRVRLRGGHPGKPVLPAQRRADCGSDPDCRRLRPRVPRRLSEVARSLGHVHV